MNELKIRRAEIKDIPFLVQTIIEAEKSGTDILSYVAIFGITVDQLREYLTDMLKEEVDDCELSVSSFMVAEVNGNLAAALSAWIEAKGGMPSIILKGNLLSYYLPKSCFDHASKVNELVSEIHIDYLPNTIQIGAGYVAEEYRGHKLLGLLNEEIIRELRQLMPDLNEVYAQIFSCNTPSLRTYERAGFEIIGIKETSNQEIFNYLPSNKKILLVKKLINN